MHGPPRGPFGFNQNAVPSRQVAVRVLHFLIGHTMRWGGCVLGTRLASSGHGGDPAAMVDLRAFVNEEVGANFLSRRPG